VGCGILQTNILIISSLTHTTSSSSSSTKNNIGKKDIPLDGLNLEMSAQKIFMLLQLKDIG
jgi:hypothetical protein